MVNNIRSNVLTGILTVIPILVTIFVFSIFLDLLSDIGRPKVVVLSNAVQPFSPQLARWLIEVPWLSSALAICLTLAMFYLLGWSMTRLGGRQLFHAVEHGLRRIPVVTTVYGATKKLIDAFRADGGSAQRVVLIEFPHARMKAVGLVTRNFTDDDTGEQLAAVYVPTAPNPTGGYLEIVPVSELVPLDWTVDEAMAFVLSGGTTAPDPIRFSRRPHEGSEGTAETSGRNSNTGSEPVQRPSPREVMPARIEARGPTRGPVAP
jgi:uncharacterized membrane protein